MIWSKKKNKSDNVTLPVWHEKKYDTLYNVNEYKRKCKHEWFYFRSCCMKLPDFDMVVSGNNNRICENCFYWESSWMKHRGYEWSWFGFGKLAFDRLTEEKLKLIMNEK